MDVRQVLPHNPAFYLRKELCLIHLGSPAQVQRTDEPTSGHRGTKNQSGKKLPRLRSVPRLNCSHWPDLSAPTTGPDSLSWHLVSHGLPSPATELQHVTGRVFPGQWNTDSASLISQMRHHRLTGRKGLAWVAQPPRGELGLEFRIGDSSQ